MSFQHMGLFAVILLFFGLIIIPWKWPQGMHMTFSQHVATSKNLIIYYCLLFAVVLPPLLLFFIGWFTPTFNVSPWFNLGITISAVFQFICTLIPEVGGRKTTYHRLFAALSAVLLLPCLLLLLLPNTVNVFSKIMVLVSLGVMLGIISLLIQSKGKHEYFLLLQSAYYAAFLLPVVFISLQ